MTEYVFSSDWHLDARTAGAPRRLDLEAAVDAVVQAVLELERHNRGNVVFCFAGDLCDPHRASSCYASAVATRVALELRAVDVDSVWLTGNHDVVQDGTGDHALLSVAAAASQSNGLTVLDRPGLAVGGELLCLPYPSTATAYDPDAWVRALTVQAPPKVVVGHLSLPDMHPGSEVLELSRGREIPWPLAALRERWPDIVVVAAHYHRAQMTADGVRVIGSLGRLTFADDQHEPGYLVVEV